MNIEVNYEEDINIQIYADSVDVRPNVDVVDVYLKGICVSQVINEFYVKDILDAIDYEHISDYVTEREKEA